MLDRDAGDKVKGGLVAGFRGPEPSARYGSPFGARTRYGSPFGTHARYDAPARTPHRTVPPPGAHRYGSPLRDSRRIRPIRPGRGPGQRVRPERRAWAR
ncbi:hypothetical protein GCM10010140_33370 [Streptosporangium pseudovulgare]|uniref:Uncharacterized protein n=1 Tax=Streptosporangium pseudovulgare TaxID=35765 RepID=A0ABQ2QW26_9ACTN|nr:hypothetical protein GCM10010140_33370 [Streptosporangium pseudovulgare]